MSPTAARSMIAPLALAVLSAAWARPGMAGPATYDPATRAFHIRYTFADVSGYGTLGGATPTKANPEQEARVRSMLADASRILSQVTDRRGTIGVIDYVETIKETDCVFVMTGQPSSPGWSTLRATNGRPGQFVIYYNTISSTTREDAANTVVHLLGHYVFGLSDEYNYTNFPNGCPTARGPGCLMDNYRPGQRGWSGRFCDDANHNKQPTQPESCQALVDRFFKENGDPPRIVDVEAEAFYTFAPQAVEEIVKDVRSNIHGGRDLHPDPAELRARAEAVLRRRFGEPKDDRSKGTFEVRVRALVDRVNGRLEADRASGLDRRTEDRLLDKAAELAAQYPEGRLAHSTRLTIIRKKLLELAMGSLGQALSPEARQQIENIALDAARITTPK